MARGGFREQKAVGSARGVQRGAALGAGWGRRAATKPKGVMSHGWQRLGTGTPPPPPAQLAARWEAGYEPCCQRVEKERRQGDQISAPNLQMSIFFFFFNLFLGKRFSGFCLEQPIKPKELHLTARGKKIIQVY